ncbi:MAG: hypothetical protein RIM72_11640 [Alphaproteobacteria bacterium]
MKKVLAVSAMVLGMFGAVEIASAASLQIIGSPVIRSIPNNFDPAGTPAPPDAITRMNDFINFGNTGVPFEVESSTGVNVASFSGSAKNSSNGLAIDFGGASSVDITFTYFGKEAAFTNLALAINGSTHSLFNNTTAQLGDTETLTFLNTNSSGPFFIPFVFRSNRGSGTPDPDPNSSQTGNDLQIANDGGATFVDSGDPVDNLELGFLQQLNGDLFTNSIGVVEGSTIAFFGDGTNDSDLDDMVIGIGITSVVPLPAPVLLLVSALAGLGFVSRMKRRIAA